ncbi:MAG TPA: hypothetical protein DEF51_15075 [Myxococcales bacterium]|nr:hypothetical protein [Myxococcales bacterium]
MPSGIVDSLPSGARVVVASRLPSPVQIARMNAKSGVMAFAMGNVDMFLGSLVDIGLFPESEKDRMRPIVSELMEHLRGADPMGGGQLDFAALRMRVLETIDRMEGVAIPQELVLYGRTFALLAGVTRSIAPDVNALAIARPLVTQALLAGGPPEDPMQRAG